LVLLVIPLVKVLMFPIKPPAKFWVLLAIEAAKSEPGRCGMDIDGVPVDLPTEGMDVPAELLR
jgi:hypothetical protein